MSVQIVLDGQGTKEDRTSPHEGTPTTFLADLCVVSTAVSFLLRPQAQYS